MSIIAFITDRLVVRKILRHLGLPSAAPSPEPIVRLRQLDLDLDLDLDAIDDQDHPGDRGSQTCRGPPLA